MKKYLFPIIFFFTLVSCEKVIDLDLEFTEKRIVVDAKINKHISKKDGYAKVIISETSSYFDNEINFIENAKVVIKELSTNNEYELKYLKENHYYTEIDNIIDNSEYELNIFHNNNHYRSKETLTNSPPITSVKQGERESLNDEEIEIITTFTDLKNEENYYLFEFGEGNLQPARDLYIDGNEFSFSYFINKKKIKNNELNIKMEGVDFDYFKFMIQIVIQTNTQNGPFSTAPSSIKGNIYCVNNEDLNPFGYFKVCEFDTYTLKDINID